MNKKTLLKIVIVSSATFLGILTGCVAYWDVPGSGPVMAPPPMVAVEVADDYVYYPGYQVYYSSNRRLFLYQEGRAWVSRPAPPRVSAEILFAAPSVRLDFHDSPARHHATVVRQYPKHWAPPGHGPGKENDRGERR